MTTIETIALNRLTASKANVRVTGRRDGLEALKASIHAHGLRQNLNVRATDTGRFEVIAGGRRLMALKQLARERAIPADLPVPCLVIEATDDATEISLAENQLREAMHPDDQCGAFQALIDHGLPVDDVAARFGVTPAVVRQRLRLAAVSPKLRAKYRAGQTTLAHMMALTLVDDHAAQETAFAAAHSADGIRRHLTQAGMRADHRLVRFIGLDAYRQAGGAVLDDLFNPEDSYVTDAALVEQLAQAQLETIAAMVQEEGWAWRSAELAFDYGADYGRVYGERDADGVSVFAPEQMTHAGVRVYLNYAGEVVTERGYVRPADRRAAGLLPDGDDGEPGTKPTRPDYPASVVLELSVHRTAALRLELARKPAVALAAVVHALVSAQRSMGFVRQSALTLECKSVDLSRHLADPSASSALSALARDLEHWSERIPAGTADAWDWCLRQDSETLLAVLAVYSALSLDALNHGDSRLPHHAQATRLASTLGLDMRLHWQPEAAFLARLSKPVMAAALRDSENPTLAADVLLLKKPAAAAKAAEALALAGWLPPALQDAASAAEAA